MQQETNKINLDTLPDCYVEEHTTGMVYKKNRLVPVNVYYSDSSKVEVRYYLRENKPKCDKIIRYTALGHYRSERSYRDRYVKNVSVDVHGDVIGANTTEEDAGSLAGFFAGILFMVLVDGLIIIGFGLI